MIIVVVQLLSHVRLLVTLWNAACHASLSFTISWNLLILMFIEPMMPSNHRILCRPLLFLPSTFPSIMVFSWCEELTHWNRLWCWERLKAGEEGDDRGCDGWMASPFNGHELEQTLEDGKGQRSLACWSPWGPWGHKELVTTEWTTMALRIRWPKYWRFSFCISPPNEHSGLISFRMDWLDLLAAQVTLKNLLQHHSSKTSILRCSVFFIVQLSHPYMTTGKTIALTKWTFVSKVMSLLFNMLSRFVDCIH